MKKISIVFTLLCALVLTGCGTRNSSQAEISNGILKAQLHLPDNENPYYQGTRFDWSGIISNLEYKGHTYFGQWFDEIGPPLNAKVMGPAEAYAPLNYNDVNIGDEFVTIGVGAMTKPSNEKYSGFNYYTIVNSGVWETKVKSNEVQFIHILNTENISYEYTKTVTLVVEEAKMVISHSLKNTGKQHFNTNGFNHNFFVIDNQPIGKDFELSFSANVSGKGRGLGDIFEIQGKKIVFKRDLLESESIAIKSLEGINNNVNNFDIRIDNLETGAGARITGDKSLSKLRLWGNSKTLCPETYLNIDVAPTEIFNWNYTYEFYISEK